MIWIWNIDNERCRKGERIIEKRGTGGGREEGRKGDREIGRKVDRVIGTVGGRELVA